MKLWNNYLKELKIASRGFYFYMEVVTAAILLAAILLFVPVEVTSVSYEAIYADLPGATFDQLLSQNFGEPGQYERAADTRVRLQAGNHHVLQRADRREIRERL